jgi:hypothetical protein
MPEGVNITVKYDKTLQVITGTEEHPVMMSKGSVFAFLLHCVFIEYPEIQEQYPPGVLAFSVNGFAPKTYSPLFDGDEVFFEVV